MLLRLCQLKSLLVVVLISFNSCATKKVPVKNIVIRDDLKPVWFSRNLSHSIFNQDEKPLPHLFFDVPPDLDEEENLITAVITTPADSRHAYALDLNSGQRYYSHSYCSQKDIWNSFEGSIRFPFYDQGIVPGFLDQAGEPQKIIVLKSKKTPPPENDGGKNQVKIIGGFIEQTCLENNCLGRNNWVSRLVLLSHNSSEAAKSEELVEWPVFKAYVENIDGRNYIGGRSYPAIKMGRILNAEDAISYLKKHSIHLSEVEAKKVQNGCHILYEKLWQDVGAERPEDRPSKTADELSNKLKLKKDLKKKGLPVGFSERLMAFTEKYYKEITTCEKFVYHGNLNLNNEKFWFLNYMGLFYRLHKDGYHYDCKRKAWGKNFLNNKGDQTYDLITDMKTCQNQDYDQAMNYMENFLVGLKHSNPIFYKFIDYDNHAFGTHRKMYTWIKMISKKFDCSNDPNERIRAKTRVFPEDVSWKPRHLKDIQDDLKIIN